MARNNDFDYEESEDVMDLDEFIPDEEETSEEAENAKLYDEYKPVQDLGIEEYKFAALSPSFLKTESKIILEESKTPVKFSYRGSFYKGVVMQQMGSHKDDYIFLVQEADKNGKVKSGTPKKLMKIHIPDASVI